MSELFKSVGDDTLLTEEEKADLIPTYITNKDELNEAEQDNILEAEYWAFKTKLTLEKLLSENLVRKLHKKMIGKVWKWAGIYRESDKNIGIPHYQIRQELPKLLDDTLYWIENKTYPADEIAVRFHHSLVLIHPFLNVNGRHARLMADLLILRLGGKRFSWGGKSLYKGEDRIQYINALKKADKGNIQPLLEMARL